MTRRSVRSGSPYEDAYGFSRAVRVGDRVAVAGTAPIPAPGTPLRTTAYEQMRRCGEIALAAMAELGAEPRHVVRTRMFIVDAADADDVGRAHAEVFSEAEPAATMIIVAQLLDADWKVEIEVEAIIDR